MRFENRSWLLLATGVMASAAIAACSADAGSGSGVGDNDSGTQDDTGASDGSTNHDSGTRDSTTPTDGSTQSDSSHADTSTADAGTLDTGTADTGTADTGTSDTGTTADASVDSGLPPVGSACSPQNSTQQEPCGLCGVQNRVCLAPDGGTPVWQPWGFCQNEVANGCTPGSMTTEACGLCGMRQKQCQNDCTYAVGACTGQPMNACTPGAIDYEPGLSCDAGGRTRTCGTNCTYGNFGNCSVPDAGTTGGGIAISLTVGSIVSATETIPATPQIGRAAPFATCPGITIDSTLTSYTYTVISNPDPTRTAVVSVWSDRATGGPIIDTIMTSYDGSTVPPPDRTACVVGVNDTCSTLPCATGQSYWAGLAVSVGTGVTIPPTSSVVIYTASYYAAVSGSAQPHGIFKLSVKTETLM